MKAPAPVPQPAVDDLDRSLPPRLDHRTIGIALCVVSAAGYSASNIFLRESANTINPFWVCCVKALPTLIPSGVWVVYRAKRGLPISMTRRVLLVLVLAALTVQMVGNVAFQMSLGIVGLAVSVPITFGAMMISGAVMGRVYLAEAVTVRAIVSMSVLMGAIVVLSLGADAAGHSAGRQTGIMPAGTTWLLAGGVVLALSAGVSYAMLGAVIRRYVGHQVTLTSMLLVVSLTGVISLALATLAVAGAGEMIETTWQEWQTMLWAGVFNAIAFFALSKALHLISLVHVNLLNASQVAMAALAGTVLFDEKWTFTLAIGVAMTMIGIVLMRRPGGKETAEI